MIEELAIGILTNNDLLESGMIKLESLNGFQRLLKFLMHFKIKKQQFFVVFYIWRLAL